MPRCWDARTEIDGYMAESGLPAQALEADPVWTRVGMGGNQPQNLPNRRELLL